MTASALGTPSTGLVGIGQPHRRALFVRVSWVSLLLCLAAAYIASLSGLGERLTLVCAGATCAPVELTPEKVADLSAIGLTPRGYAVWLAVLDTSSALVFVAVGSVLIWRRPTDRVAVFAAFTLALFGGVTNSEILHLAARVYPPLGVVFALLDTLGRSAFTAFVFVFPNGRFVPRWTRWVALAWIGVQLPIPFLRDNADSPLRAIIDPLIDPSFIVGLAVAAWAQAYRYRRISSSVERQQTRWTAFGITVAIILYLAVGSAQRLVPGFAQALAGLLAPTLSDVALALPPLSIGVALLWYGLYDLDALIGRTLVYAGLTAGIVATYMLVVGYLGTLFRTSDNLLISLIGTGAAAALVQPLRERLQRGANRLLYGQRDDPYSVVSDLGRRLDNTAAPAAMLTTIPETIVRALKLPYAAIRVQGEPKPVEAGALVGEPVHIPLMYQGQSIGELLLGSRGRAEPFGPADRRLLEDLARQAAAVVHTLRLAAEVQRSREQLVNAREEERRRLRRDLHDGLGPTLAAFSLKLETARNRIAHDAQAAALLADLAERAQGAVLDIRRLVSALRPPALDELGLAGALRQVARAAEPNPASVRVEVSGPEVPLPAAVEVAAFRIAQEALTNVSRHAHARSCAIRLRCSEAAVELDVEDDGVGVSSEGRAGVGLGSMRERAEELGGTFVLEHRAEGGTRVRAVLPLARGAVSS
jgi:signal transduction histidine kinase